MSRRWSEVQERRVSERRRSEEEKMRRRSMSKGANVREAWQVSEGEERGVSELKDWGASEVGESRSGVDEERGVSVSKGGSSREGMRSLLPPAVQGGSSREGMRSELPPGVQGGSSREEMRSQLPPVAHTCYQGPEGRVRPRVTTHCVLCILHCAPFKLYCSLFTMHTGLKCTVHYELFNLNCSL